MIALRQKYILIATMVAQITVTYIYLTKRSNLHPPKIGILTRDYEPFQRDLPNDGSYSIIRGSSTSYPMVVMITSSKNTTEKKPSTQTVVQRPKSRKPYEKKNLAKNIGRKQDGAANKIEGPKPTVKSELQKQFNNNTTSDELLTNDTYSSKYFQPIDNKQAWLYSAFYDHMAAKDGKPLVRVFGLAKTANLKKVYCTITSEGRNLTATGSFVILPDTHGVNYPPAHLECLLSKNAHPTHIAVSFDATKKPVNRLQVLYPGPRIRNFTVCYSALHSHYNSSTQLIESIEMNRLLGAEHFMVYNYSISPEISQILRRYQDDGLVTVLQWPIPTNGSWYFGQMTALNDCFYRNRNTSRFVVVADTDELIVPRSHYTWMEIIHNVSQQERDVSTFFPKGNKSSIEKTLTGCFMIRSSHFSADAEPKWDLLSSEFPFTEEEKKNIIKYKIRSLSQLIRTQSIFPYRIRSKYIARPELVYNAGIHKVQKFIYYMQCLYINESVALLHHYKRYNLKTVITQDNSALKFKNILYPRVMEMIKRFPKIFA